eukprot:3703726-Rhodomonas_salina.2
MEMVIAVPADLVSQGHCTYPHPCTAATHAHSSMRLLLLGFAANTWGLAGAGREASEGSGGQGQDVNGKGRLSESGRFAAGGGLHDPLSETKSPSQYWTSHSASVGRQNIISRETNRERLRLQDSLYEALGHLALISHNTTRSASARAHVPHVAPESAPEDGAHLPQLRTPQPQSAPGRYRVSTGDDVAGA